MKNIIILVIIAAAAFFAYTHFFGGASLPADEQEVALLEEDFKAISAAFKQAEKGAAVSGMDASADAASAVADLKELEKELKTLEGTLSSPSAKERARQLKKMITDFKRKLS